MYNDLQLPYYKLSITLDIEITVTIVTLATIL